MNMMSKDETEVLATVTGLGSLISRHERTHTSSKFRKVMAYIVGGGTAALILLGASRDPAAYGILSEAVQKEPTKDAAVEALGWLGRPEASVKGSAALK